jgi:hypothetical protein
LTAGRFLDDRMQAPILIIRWLDQAVTPTLNAEFSSLHDRPGQLRPGAGQDALIGALSQIHAPGRTVLVEAYEVLESQGLKFIHRQAYCLAV